MNYKDYINYLYEIGILERIRHEGFIYVKVKNPESVALHVLRAAEIAIALEKMEGLKAGEGVMAVIFHENGEARIGDLHNVAKRYVTADEDRAVMDQTKNLGGFGEEVLKVWREVENKTTLRGKIGKDCDLLELALDAKYLMEQGYSRSLQKWIENAALYVSTDSGKKLMQDIKSMTTEEWMNKYLEQGRREEEKLLRRAHISVMLNFFEQKVSTEEACLWAVRGEKVSEEWQKDVIIIEEALMAYEGIDYRKMAWEEMNFGKEAYTIFAKELLKHFKETDPDEFWYKLKNVVRK